MKARRVTQIIRARPTSDGAGVKLRRSIGSGAQARSDPFLLLDEFSSDDAADYIGGFPAHPHRGFETVTYMLDGHMLHEDHLGHRGDLRSGDVQWMTAGRGIIHSEMPQQTAGRMRGFQLWLNLPARDKMQPAAYRDIPAGDIPVQPLVAGGQLKLIAGQLALDGAILAGPINTDASMATDPIYADVSLPADAGFRQPLGAEHNVVLYVFEGRLEVDGLPVETHHALQLGDGDAVEVQAGAEGARFLLLAGKPLGEPVVQYGPFVMNTHKEIEQAMRDYASGQLTRADAA